ncbi:MAG: hypothetical protein HQL22_11915 [Candidatus Omnitrophica bacterium]|nr:hypothetical protein [Candidatus Omnitrophota bacterium]
MNDKKALYFWKFVSVFLMGLILFSILLSLHYPWEKLLFINSDFEKGDLTNWTAEGRAFLNQPTLGDNSLYRGRGAANMRGRYWVGSVEDHHTKDQTWGKLQGDHLTGTLTSIPFLIERNHIGFMIGGGDSSLNERVVLMVDGKEVATQSGWGNTIDTETMSRVVWDISPWKGKKAYLIIIDSSTGPWGHINVDDFRYL